MQQQATQVHLQKAGHILTILMPNAADGTHHSSSSSTGSSSSSSEGGVSRGMAAGGMLEGLVATQMLAGGGCQVGVLGWGSWGETFILAGAQQCSVSTASWGLGGGD
jgi:hypothetical protein